MAEAFTTAFVAKVFQERGATLLSPYESANKPVRFRCLCGTDGDVAFVNLYYRKKKDGSPVLPRCKECIRAAKREHGTSATALASLQAGRDASAWTEERARGLVERCGSVLVRATMKGAASVLQVTCACCGELLTQKLESLAEVTRGKPDHQIRCKRCVGKANAGARFATAQITEESHTYLRNHGCEPRYDQYPGKNSLPLLFLCSCGERTHTITWGQIKLGAIPRCTLCQLKARPRGKHHDRYKPHLTDQDRAKSAYGRKNQFPVWQRAVLGLHGFRCAITGHRGGQLAAHHLRSWAEHPSERFLVSNAVVLAKDVHEAFHRDWVGGLHIEATEQDFAAFYRDRTGSDFVPLLRRVVPEIVFAFTDQPDLLVRKRVYREQGRTYLPFYETEVRTQVEIVNSMIRNREGLTPNKTGARKLTLVELNHREAEAFFTANHIQGHTNAACVLALTDGGVVYSAMAFTPVRVRAKTHPEGSWELARFANKVDWVVMGSASKLLQAFLDRHRPPLIVTYADRRFCADTPDATMYPGLGFAYSHASQASYSYTLDGLVRLNKKSFQRQHLPEVLGQHFDPDLTEWENMERAGYARLPDCGTFVYHLKP